MQANSRWLHSVRKSWRTLFATTKKRGVKKNTQLIFASTELRIFRLHKYPIDPKLIWSSDKCYCFDCNDLLSFTKLVKYIPKFLLSYSEMISL